MIKKHYIGLEWIGEIDGCDLELLCTIIERSFEGELPTFTIRHSHLCVVLNQDRVGEWTDDIARYFDGLVKLGLIYRWVRYEPI